MESEASKEFKRRVSSSSSMGWYDIFADVDFRKVAIKKGIVLAGNSLSWQEHQEVDGRHVSVDCVIMMAFMCCMELKE